MRRTKLAVALVLAGAISAPSAYALGLGAIEVKSALNQPLDARIPLLPADEGELETLSVSLASAAAFQRAGVDRPFSLTRLRFTLVRGDQPYVRVSTEQPVKEPFLDFLVQADWDRGRLVREFTLLLDPPIYAGSGVAPIMAPTPVSGSSHRPTAGAAEVVASGAVTTVSPAATSAVEAAGRRYGPVGPNDTLWKIASELRPADSVSVNQVMIALLRANPDAFIDGDINRLRRGSTLQMPELAQIAAINAATANQEVRAQMQRWRQANAAAQPRGRLQVVAPPEDSAREADAARPEQAAADRATLDGLRQEVLGYRESNVSLQAENEDLKAQVEGLKQELAHFERLLSLSVQQPVVAETAAAPAELVADHEAELREAAELAAQPAEATASEQPVAAEATQPKPAEAPKAAPVVPEVREPSFFDEPSNLTTLGGAAAAVLGLLYLLVRRRRAAAEADEAADVVLSAELEQPEEAPLEPVAAEASQEPEEEAAVDLASAAAAAADDLPEGDALSEAEVYLAYGRYDQARELLENALEQEPEHTGVRLKLLETLALLQDEDSFIIHSRLLHGQVGDNDEAWQLALEMGREFLPEETLFSAEPLAPEPVAPPAEEATFDLDFDLDSLAPVEPVKEAPEPSVAALPEEKVDDFSIDFELPEPQSEQAATDAIPSSEPADSPELADAGEFKLPDLNLGEMAVGGSDENVLDFTQPADEGGAAETSGLDDLNDLDEVGIKLNLARAYLDMGDGDGARSLIDEVLAEGSSRQREEAEGLLQQLA